MKKLFRSIIDIRNKEGKSTIDQEDLTQNYRAFLSSKVQPEGPSYIKLYTWIEAHYREYKEVPTIQLLISRAEKDGDEGVLATIKDIITETPFYRSDYKVILKETFEEQNRDRLQAVLTKTWQAANEGIEVKKKKVKGLDKAIEYFIGESRAFRMNSLGVKTESDTRSQEDSKEVIEAYQKKKANQIQHLGMYTFLDRIDDSCRGIKPGELVLLAAFVAQGKSTTMANLGYNGAMQGLNGLVIPLEMSHDEMRNMFYVLHTCNSDWYEHPKFKGIVGKIWYDKVQYGELTADEEEFFQDASKDFSNREDFGSLFVYQPPEALTPSRLEMVANDYNAQLKEKGKQLDYLIVDYIGLMIPDKGTSYGEWNTDLNMLLKWSKNFAMTFDGGRKLRFITPFQINRSGHKEAEKTDGVYKLSALSNANEAERSGDLIYTTYFNDDMKKAGLIKFGCLKDRRGPGFDPFEAKIDFNTKQIRDHIQVKASDKDVSIINIPMDVQ